MELEDGNCVYADTVLSNATSHTTFLGLLPGGVLPPEFEASVRSINYTSPVCKINGASLSNACICVISSFLSKSTGTSCICICQ